MTGGRRLQPRKKPIQERSRRTVAVILEAAAQVFEEQGYARATTDRIAARAGVSVGSLYQYFPGKDALLVALTEQHLDEGVALVRRLLAASADVPLASVPLHEILRHFLRAMIALHRPNPRLHQMLFFETPKPEGLLDEFRAREDELAGELRAVLERHPEVRWPDPALGTYVLVHVVEGLVHDYVVRPPPGEADEERFLDEAVRLLMGYLSPAA